MNEEPFLKFDKHGPITVGYIQAVSVLDAANVRQFGDETMRHVQGQPSIHLLLDFEQVGYLSSAVLTELLRLNQTISEAKGSLRLCGLNSDIRKVFEITNLDKLFHIDDALEHALKRYVRSLEVAAQEEGWSLVNKDEG